jgi:hypothetical protein
MLTLQNTVMSVGSWSEHWNININKGQARCFSLSLKIGHVENQPALNRRNMPSVKMPEIFLCNL